MDLPGRNLLFGSHVYICHGARVVCLRDQRFFSGCCSNCDRDPGPVVLDDPDRLATANGWGRISTLVDVEPDVFNR